MSRRLDEDDEEIRGNRAERELTLGTGAILAIFFGAVVLLGAFFGFGYKVGSSASKTVGSASSDTPEPAAASTSPGFNTFKPAAGSPVSDGNGATAPGIAVRAGGTPVITAPTGGSAATHTNPAAAAPTTLADADTPAPTAPLTLAHSGSSAPPQPAALAPMPATTPGGSFVVQVAAVSHQEDADLLVNALHGKGYAVAARSEPGDRLVHIQVGPFKDKKDADAMRQRLLADGYNAYIK